MGMGLRIKSYTTVVVAEGVNLRTGKVWNTPLAAPAEILAEKFCRGLKSLIRRKRYERVWFVGLTGNGRRYMRQNGLLGAKPKSHVLASQPALVG